MKYVKSTKRSAFFILFLLVGLLLVSIAWALLQKSEKQNIIGVKAPTFQVTSFDNREINSKEYLGKVLVLNFWASWCDTCAEEAEMLEAVWKEYLPSKEVIFLGINYMDTEKEALAYIKKYGISYPNGMDKGLKISKQFQVTGVPETIFIDTQGIIQYKKIGPFVAKKEITALVDNLLRK